MKKSIKFSALVVLFSAGIFASASAKETKEKEAAATEQVSFAGSKNASLNISTNSSATVRFYDQDKNLLLANRISGKTQMYNLASLEDGTYTVTISANHQDITKKVVVYEENDQKSFFIVQ